MTLLRVSAISTLIASAPALVTGCAGRFDLMRPSAANASSDDSSDQSKSRESSESSDDSSATSDDTRGSSEQGGSSHSEGGSTKGSSDSRSETSNTVTTKGDADTPNRAGLFVLTGVVLLGATTLAGWMLLVEDEPETYVTRHERDIRLALARGEGPFVRDLGARLGITHAQVDHLSGVLRGGRPLLEVELGRGEMSRESAERFVVTLVELLRVDQQLGPLVDDLMQRIERATVHTTHEG